MSQVKTHATEVQKKTEPARQLEQEVTRQPEQGPVQQVAPQAAYQRAQVNRNGLRAADVLALQRTVGNRTVYRWLVQKVPAEDKPEEQAGGASPVAEAATPKVAQQQVFRWAEKLYGLPYWFSDDATVSTLVNRQKELQANIQKLKKKLAAKQDPKASDEEQAARKQAQQDLDASSKELADLEEPLNVAKKAYWNSTLKDLFTQKAGQVNSEILTTISKYGVVCNTYVEVVMRLSGFADFPLTDQPYRVLTEEYKALEQKNIKERWERGKGRPDWALDWGQRMAAWAASNGAILYDDSDPANRTLPSEPQSGDIVIFLRKGGGPFDYHVNFVKEVSPGKFALVGASRSGVPSGQVRGISFDKYGADLPDKMWQQKYLWILRPRYKRPVTEPAKTAPIEAPAPTSTTAPPANIPVPIPAATPLPTPIQPAVLQRQLLTLSPEVKVLQPQTLAADVAAEAARCNNQDVAEKIMNENPRRYDPGVTTMLHEVKAGDTLWKLASRDQGKNTVTNAGDLAQELQALNRHLGFKPGNCIILIKDWVSPAAQAHARRTLCDERIKQYRADKTYAAYTEWEQETVKKDDKEYKFIVQRVAARNATLYQGRLAEYCKLVEELNKPWIGPLNEGDCVALPVGWKDPNIGALPAKPGDQEALSDDIRAVIATVYAEQTSDTSQGQEQRKYIWYSIRKRIETSVRGPDINTVLSLNLVRPSEYQAIGGANYTRAMTDLANLELKDAVVAKTKQMVLANWSTPLPADAGTFYFHWEPKLLPQLEACYGNPEPKDTASRERHCAWAFANSQDWTAGVSPAKGWLKCIRGDNGPPKERIGSMYIYP